MSRRAASDYVTAATKTKDAFRKKAERGDINIYILISSALKLFLQRQNQRHLKMYCPPKLRPKRAAEAAAETAAKKTKAAARKKAERGD